MGRQLFTRRVKSRQQKRWREAKKKRVAEAEEEEKVKKKTKGRFTSEEEYGWRHPQMDRMTGQQTAESEEVAAFCTNTSAGTRCNKIIKDIKTDSAACCKSDVRDRGEKGMQKAWQLYLHVRSACLLPFLKLFRTTRRSSARNGLKKEEVRKQEALNHATYHQLQS